MKKANVIVLMGGWSSEREVSLVSGKACASALIEAGMSVETIDVQSDLRSLIEKLSPRPDVILNALHGCFGEDGCVQGLLDVLGIPYTHSGRLASALAMNKPMAKIIFDAEGIPTAKHRIINAQTFRSGDPIPRPYVLKPCDQGSSIGVHIVEDGDNLAFVDNLFSENKLMMVEEYIAGQEFTVAVMGDRALSVTDITTKRDFYDYHAKYEEGGSQHLVPAKIKKDLADEMMGYALSAHRALGCRGVTRSDFRYDGMQTVILALNTQPGMTPQSLVPEQAASVGVSFTELVLWMIENAEYDS